MIKKRVEESLILNLIALGERLKRRRDIISQNLGVSTQQWLILLHLAQDPNIPYLQKKPQKKPLLASEIAESLGVSRPNITNMLNGLMDKGLIIQVEDDLDKRRKRLTLSERGEALLQNLQPHREELNAALFADLNVRQKQSFLAKVEQCLKVLDEQYDNNQYDEI
jgi:DNA-binding MarR family transcriptional regulator